jgi:Tfp pilus assembly PilM family ATPase
MSGYRLRVSDFAMEELLVSNPEAIAQQLETLVQRKGLRSSSTALALSGPEVVHRLLDFPTMPLRELGPVVEREIRAVGGVGGKEVVFDWEVIEESDSGNLSQVRVLVAIAPKSQVDGTLQLLERCHLKPALLTTAPISLLRSLGFVEGEGVGLRVVLYIGDQQGYLLGVKDGRWSFYREFSSKPSDAKEAALVEEALREANRALLYHRQRHPEEGGITFLLGGGGGLDDLLVRLQREMGVEGKVVRAGQALDLAPLEQRANIFRDVFPSLMIPVGLVAAFAQKGINLVPKTVRKPVARRSAINLSSLYRPVLPAILLLLLLAVHLILAGTERYYQRLLKDRAALYDQWLPAIRAAEESRALHDNEKLLEQSLGSRRIGESSWIALFKALSQLVPPELVLQSMGFQRDKDEWLIVLKGQAVSMDSYAAQAAFNRFYQGLKGYPHLEKIELLPVDVSTLAEREREGSAKTKPGATEPEKTVETRAEGVEAKKTRVQFEIHGHLKGI